MKQNIDTRHKNKGGRPKKEHDKVRNIPVKVYLTQEWKDRLDYGSQEAGVSISTYIYELIVNGRIVEPITPELADILRKIAGECNNINQLVHESHIAGAYVLERECRNVLNKLDTLLTKVLENDCHYQ